MMAVACFVWPLGSEPVGLLVLLVCTRIARREHILSKEHETSSPPTSEPPAIVCANRGGEGVFTAALPNQTPTPRALFRPTGPPAARSLPFQNWPLPSTACTFFCTGGLCVHRQCAAGGGQGPDPLLPRGQPERGPQHCVPHDPLPVASAEGGAARPRRASHDLNEHEFPAAARAVRLHGGPFGVGGGLRGDGGC